MNFDEISSYLKNDSSLFLSYKDDFLTRESFHERIDTITKLLKEKEILNTENFIALNSDNPLHFYPLIFACWLNNLKIYFPNKDFLDKNTTFENCKYTLTYDGEYIHFEENHFYTNVPCDQCGDTVLFSSGSTGKPKGILHHHNHFFENAKSVFQEIDMENYTSITLLKPYLVSSLSHFLVHLFSKSHLIFVDIDDIRAITTYSKEYPKLNVVGSPIHLIMTLNYLDKNAHPTYFFSSGDLIYPSIIEKIFKLYPATLFFHVYGLAELAGRFFINRYDINTDKIEYYKIGKNIIGTNYIIKENQLYVDSKFLFYGYIKDNLFIPSPRPFCTGDKVIEDNGLILEGRADDEIKIGGNKLSLKNIERKISDLFENMVTIIVPFQQEPFGTLMAMCIHGDRQYTKQDLLKHLRETLKPYELPHKYYKIDKIEYTQTFKIDRKKISQNLSSYEEIR